MILFFISVCFRNSDPIKDVFTFATLSFSLESALSLSRKMWKRGVARFCLQIMYSIHWQFQITFRIMILSHCQLVYNSIAIIKILGMISNFATGSLSSLFYHCYQIWCKDCLKYENRMRLAGAPFVPPPPHHHHCNGIISTLQNFRTKNNILHIC